MSRESVNAQIDTDITNKTAESSVTAANVGDNMKAVNNRIEEAIGDQRQNNLMPTAEKSPTVNAVLAGLESVAEDVQAQIDEGIAGVYKDAGNYDASVGTFPTQTAQGNAVEAGDLFTVSVAGTLGGVAYVPGESFRALVNTPGQTSSNWQKLVYVAGTQTTTTVGLVRKATDAEVVAGTANDNSVSTKQLQDKLDNLPSGGQPLTVGEVISANNNTALLTFGINQVYSGGASNYRVVLPDSVDAGTEKYLYIFDAVNIRGNAANTAVIKTGAASATGSLTAVSGQVYRFVKLDGNDWSYEILYGAVPKYKSYVALISQSGTSAPTAKVMENTLGATISFSRTSAGVYVLIASSSVLTTDKTTVNYTYSPRQYQTAIMEVTGRTTSTINLRTADLDVEATPPQYNTVDCPFTDIYFEIRVYN